MINMIGFAISLIIVSYIISELLTLFQINSIEKRKQTIKFNNGFCSKCGKRFKRIEPDYLDSYVEYQCESCNYSVDIYFDSINNKFLEDNDIITHDKEYEKYKKEIEREICL